MNFAEVINKAKRSDFDNIISNAKLSENRMYNIEYGQSLFKVKRRDCKRLHLVCKKDEGCKFSIVYGVTKCKTMTELHTCSVSKLLKKNVPSGIIILTSNITSEDISKTECPTPTSADSSLILFQQTTGTSFVEVGYCDSSLIKSSENINDADSPPPSTADFIWSSNNNCEATLIPKPVSGYETIVSSITAQKSPTVISTIPHSFLAPPRTITDCVWSSANDNCKTPLIPKPEPLCAMSSPCTSTEVDYSGSSSMISSENVNDADSPPPSTADFIWSSNDNYDTTIIPKPVSTIVSSITAEKSLTLVSTIPHSTLAPPRTITDCVWSSNDNCKTPLIPKPKPSCAIFGTVITESQKFLEDIISVIDTQDYTSDQKIQLSSRVQEILKTKYGFKLFKEIFRACPVAERNDMILQLQMINSMKKDVEESRRKHWSDFLQEEMQPLKRYRKDKFDYGDDDEDEVTYLDIK